MLLKIKLNTLGRDDLVILKKSLYNNPDSVIVLESLWLNNRMYLPFSYLFYPKCY